MYENPRPAPPGSGGRVAAAMRSAHRLPLAVLGLSLVACAHRPAPPIPRAPAAPRVYEAAAIRRVCLQSGLGQLGTGGGSIVLATGPEGGGQGIDTLRGDHVVVNGADALCPVPEQAMRVCPLDPAHTGEVEVRAGLLLGARPTGTVARGAPLPFYEYVSYGGVTHAVVAIGGKVGFIPADEVCHAEPQPSPSLATSTFKMDVSVSGGPRSFRPRSLATIRRIVIHNTEIPLLQTLNHFGRPEANTSAHVVIDRDGSFYRVVEDHFSAFHAGSSKDGFGGYNSTSLGIEVVAYDHPRYGGESNKFAGFTDAQRAAVKQLVDFWMDTYHLAIEPDVLANRAATAGYADLEYRKAALTIHRLTKADRGTDCPRLLFPSSPEGDEAFFRWREATFGPGSGRARRE